jgi:tetratricopeptide (TPR) repeat protein
MSFWKKFFGKNFNKLSELRRYEEALEAYDRAIELQPDYALAW